MLISFLVSIKAQEEDPNMLRLMIGAVISSFLLSYGMQILIHSIPNITWFAGGGLGVVVWFTFALTHSLNTQFEGRPPLLLVINNGLYLFTYAIFGALLAIWS